MDYWTSAISFQRLRAKYIDCTNCRLCSELREADGHGDFLFDRHFFRLLTDRVSILRYRGRDTPVNAVYVLLLCAGIGITGIVFEVKGIENNTLPAIKIGGLLILGIISATTGFFVENSKIKKWSPANTDYKISRACIIGFVICVIMYGLMCVV